MGGGGDYWGKTKVRDNGLSNPDISLADLLQYARTLELTSHHSKQIQSDSDSVNHTLSEVYQTKHFDKPEQHPMADLENKIKGGGGGWLDWMESSGR